MPNPPPGTERISLADRLNRAWQGFTGRDFGPGQPLQPRVDPTSPEQTEGPRQYQYPVAVNTRPLPRRDDVGLTPFEQLRNLAFGYDVATIAIASKIEEIQGLDHGFAAKDRKRQKDFQEACDEASRFFALPDGLNDWSTWLGMAMFDTHSIDALSIYIRPTADRKSLYGLELVDGTTIKPLLDDRGRTLAYQQVLYGYPFSEYKRPNTEADDEDMPTFGRDELLYKPRWMRTYTPYGSPPTEWIILRVNQALRKQMFDLSWFTDGSSPEGFAFPPDKNLDPKAVQDFEEWFNAVLAGNDAERHRIKFFPWNMNFMPWKQFSYETALDEWMLKITCAAFGIPPQEIGFTNDINKGTADMQENINERRGTRPTAKWFKDSIVDPVIPLLGGMDQDQTRTISLRGRPTFQPTNPFAQIELQWKFGEREDRLVQAQADQIYWNMGVASDDEFRSLRFGDELDGPAPGAPTQQPDPLGAGGSPLPLPFRRPTINWDDEGNDDQANESEGRGREGSGRATL